MKSTVTKGQLEASITLAITQFEREHLGKGPKDARSFVVKDLILVRVSGLLSPAEKQLAVEPGGTDLIKQMRTRLIEGASERLKQLIQRETGLEVVSLHTDISTRTGERIFVFTLAGEPDFL